MSVTVAGFAYRVFVPLADQRGQVGQVASIGTAAEDDFDDRGVPDGVTFVIAPLGACLGQ